MTNTVLVDRLKHTLTQDEFDHAISVADNFDDNSFVIVALLHDFIEDEYATLSDVKAEWGLDSEQVEALDAITRRAGERYFSYIKRCKLNEMARTIKLADLKDNMQRCMRDLPNRWSGICRYAKAYGILRDEWKESKR